VFQLGSSRPVSQETRTVAWALKSPHHWQGWVKL